jgi:hypothetical protein
MHFSPCAKFHFCTIHVDLVNQYKVHSTKIHNNDNKFSLYIYDILLQIAFCVYWMQFSLNFLVYVVCSKQYRKVEILTIHFSWQSYEKQDHSKGCFIIQSGQIRTI